VRHGLPKIPYQNPLVSSLRAWLDRRLPKDDELQAANLGPAPDGSVSPDASSASARRTERSVSRAASPTKRNDPKDVVEQFFDAYRELDVDGIVDLLSVDIIFEDPTFRLREVGRDGIRRMATEVRATYSGVAIDVHSMLVSGDAVAAEVTMSWVVARPDGTRHIKVRGASFFRVRAGRIFRWTDYYDARTFTEQMRRIKAG
jgi:steroid delta-isomerase-like uncharacterized protein